MATDEEKNNEERTLDVHSRLVEIAKRRREFKALRESKKKIRKHVGGGNYDRGRQ